MVFIQKSGYILWTIILSCMIVFGSGCSRKTIVISTDTASQESDQSCENETISSECYIASDYVITNTERSDISEKKLSDPQIAVFVCGAVMRPGIVYLNADARVSDALDAAGGFTSSADREWGNLAARLEDGQKIRFLTKEETALMEADSLVSQGDLSDGSVPDSIHNDKININTADKQLLMTLPGIGSARAEAILSYRQTNGGFRSVDEILKISGIKNSVFDQIRDRICV